MDNTGEGDHLIKPEGLPSYSCPPVGHAATPDNLVSNVDEYSDGKHEMWSFFSLKITDNFVILFVHYRV